MKNIKYNYEMKRLLIATHNKGKLNEIKKGLKAFEERGLAVLSLNELNIAAKPEETGKTFEENSRLKAKFYGDMTKLAAIADDGGLIIPYLNNGPGVKSRRWPGYEATDEELINYTLTHLKGVKKADRTAYLETCICFYSLVSPNPQGSRNPEGSVIICEPERVKGYIAEKPSSRRIKGYPYRALLIIDKFNKYYDDLSKLEHQQINHRLKALKRLVKKVKKYLIQ